MQSRKKFRTIDRRTLKLLQAYGWPGNVRELQNVIERAVILSEGDIFCVDETWLKRQAPQFARPAAALNSALLQQEKEMIEAALAESGGRVSGPDGAATKLGFQGQRLMQKSADWESTNIGSKFISRTDPCLPGNPVAFAH